MATLSTSVLTLADWAKRLDPNGQIAVIIEILAQQNEILMDMLWKEGNLSIGERTVIRTGLPTVYWRTLNQGVQPSKARTAQITESCGILEAWSEVDKKLADLSGNVGAFRLSEAKAFIEAMNQEMAGTLFYGNSGLAPEEFNGLAIRYGDLTANNATNLVSGGGATGQTDCTSIWFVVWGENTVHGIFPKGSTVGLQRVDRGVEVVETAAGSTATPTGTRMEAYREKFSWDAGLVVKDWRFAVRVHSIDISSDSTDYFDVMTKAYHRLPNLNVGKPVIYMNRTISQRLDLLARSDVSAGGGLTWETVDGAIIKRFRGIPIRVVDAITETENSLN